MKRHKGYTGTVLRAAFLSCMAYTLHAEASEKNTPLKTPSNINAEVDRLNAISVETIHGDVAGKTPAFLTTKNCDFFITGDLLCRKVKLDNLDFVTKLTYNYSNVPVEDSSIITMKENIYEPHFRWGWGFRVDAGYVFSSRDAWEVDLVWTYLYDKAHQSVSTPTSLPGAVVANVPATALLSSWPNLLATPPNIISTFFSSASSQWRLHFNTYDFELARNYFLSRYISIRPLIGLRGAWIKQHYLVDYAQPGNAVVTAPSVASMDAKQTYWGLGPRLGVDVFMHATKHWGFYGNLSGSLLYGQFKVSQLYSSLFATGTGVTQDFLQVKTSRDPYRTRVNIDAGVGTQWETFLDKKQRYHLTWGLGYEIAYWFGFNQLERTQTVIDANGHDVLEENGDLGMQGWNFHIRFDF